MAVTASGQVTISSRTPSAGLCGRVGAPSTPTSLDSAGLPGGSLPQERAVAGKASSGKLALRTYLWARIGSSVAEVAASPGSKLRLRRRANLHPIFGV